MKKTSALIVGLIMTVTTVGSVMGNQVPVYTLEIENINLSNGAIDDLAQQMRSQLGSVCGIGETGGAESNTRDLLVECNQDDVWQNPLSLNLNVPENDSSVNLKIMFENNQWTVNSEQCQLSTLQENDFYEQVDHACQVA